MFYVNFLSFTLTFPLIQKIMFCQIFFLDKSVWAFGPLYSSKTSFCIKPGIINTFDTYRSDSYNRTNLYRYVWCYTGRLIEGLFITCLGKRISGVRSQVLEKNDTQWICSECFRFCCEWNLIALVMLFEKKCNLSSSDKKFTNVRQLGLILPPSHEI